MFSNAKPNIPDLFKAIMDADQEIDALKAEAIVSIDDFKSLKVSRRELTHDAERALSRSPDNRNRAR